MAAGVRDVFDQEATQLIAELGESFAWERTHVRGGGDAGEQGEN